MKERTLHEIERQIEIHAKTGDVVKVSALVDEKDSIFEKMLNAIVEGDLEKIYQLEELGVNVTRHSLLVAAIKNDQLRVVCHQVHKGANINLVIWIASEFERLTIWKWARSWKLVNRPRSWKIVKTPNTNNPKEQK